MLTDRSGWAGVGADPMSGAGGHRIDEDLLTVLCSHPNCHIVTRNRHKESIEAFLAGKGVPKGTVPVRVRVHLADC